jgi:hypothetical protein
MAMEMVRPAMEMEELVMEMAHLTVEMVHPTTPAKAAISLNQRGLAMWPVAAEISLLNVHHRLPRLLYHWGPVMLRDAAAISLATVPRRRPHRLYQ